MQSTVLLAQKSKKWQLCQLCAGQESGCEAAVTDMQKIFSDENTEAILQADANNAFNCLNRQSTLRNIQVLCPSFATVLINTYRTAQSHS